MTDAEQLAGFNHHGIGQWIMARIAVARRRLGFNVIRLRALLQGVACV